MGGNGGGEVGPWVEDTVHTLLEMPRLVPRTAHRGLSARRTVRGAPCTVGKLGPLAHGAPCTAYHHSGPELDAWSKKEGARRERG